MKKVLLLTLAAFAFISAQAQWTQNQNLEGGSVNSIAKVGSNLFCATNGGVFTSTDNAANWAFAGKGIGTNLGRLAVNQLLVNGTTLIAISGTNFSRTTDNGTTWTSVAYKPKAATDQIVSAVVFNNAIYATVGRAAGFGGGGNLTNYLIKSTDNGATFTEVTSVSQKVANGNLSVANGSLYSTSDTIYSSSNGSAFTAFSMTGIPEGSTLGTVVGDGTTLFISGFTFATGAPAGGVYRYNTLLQNWSSAITGLPAGGIPFNLRGAATTLFVGVFDLTAGSFEIYKSTSANIWTKMNGTGLTNVNATDIKTFDNGVTIYGGFPDGVYSTTDNGDNWTKKNTKLTATVHNQSTAFNNTYFTNIDAPFTVVKSIDNGVTLSPLSVELPTTGFRDFSHSSNALFVGMRIGGGNRGRDTLFKSTDGGTSFETVELPLIEGETYTLAGNSGNQIFLRAAVQGGTPVYYQSKNNGTTWEDLRLPSGLTNPSGLVGNQAGTALYMYGRGNSGNNQRLYLSKDAGKTWGLDTAGLNKALRTINIVAADTFSFIASYDSVSQKIDLFTRKSGTKWARLNPIGLPEKIAVQQVNTYKKAIYVATAQSIYISKDGGKTFESFKDGLYDGILKTSIAFSGTNALLTTNGNGVWKITAPEGVNPSVALVSTAVADVEAIENNSLGQNFPNPATNNTTINYTVNSNELVSINLYSVNGQLVKTLVNESKAPGSYTTTVDLSDVANGIYTYKMTNGALTTVKKLTVVK